MINCFQICVYYQCQSPILIFQLQGRMHTYILSHWFKCLSHNYLVSYFFQDTCVGKNLISHPIKSLLIFNSPFYRAQVFQAIYNQNQLTHVFIFRNMFTMTHDSVVFIYIMPHGYTCNIYV